MLEFKSMEIFWSPTLSGFQKGLKSKIVSFRPNFFLKNVGRVLLAWLTFWNQGGRTRSGLGSKARGK